MGFRRVGARVDGAAGSVFRWHRNELVRIGVVVAETLVEGSPSGGILCQVMVLKEGGVGITEILDFWGSEWAIRRTHKSERSYAQVGTLVRTSRNARTHKSERFML